ncbi:DDHD domain-containing protein [Colletotrichum musicola]|uniref:DDHD domain-containing protein n=1 Tax=Colletotrichum musicola TaxID=2175873 RepID=A0A8H6KF41_9PEZI|nr:DDHD domain-containing protein [Colletotrichum musicola]
MSSPPKHTYGSKCRLTPVSHPPSAGSHNDIPPAAAQYFYTSVMPIDDPLSSGTVAGASDSRVARGPIRPFSLGDNNALEKAWLSFLSDENSKAHQELVRDRSLSFSAEKANANRLALLTRYLATKHAQRHGGSIQETAEQAPDLLPNTPIPVCCPDLFFDISTELQNTFCALARKYHRPLHQENVVQEVMMEMKRQVAVHVASGEMPQDPATGFHVRPRVDSVRSRQMGIVGSFSPRREAASELSRSHKESAPAGFGAKARVRSDSRTSEQTSRPSTPSMSTPLRPPLVDDGISGRPFLRAGIRQRPQDTLAKSFPPVDTSNTNSSLENDSRTRPTLLEPTQREADHFRPQDVQDGSYKREAVDVVVGVSRLHMVSIPALQMKPIYWSPVNDIAVVLRATWFYRDTMLPIPPAVANQLEAGYRELQPYTETWSDELRCAVEVGPLGEEKVSHRLWSEDGDYPTDGDKHAVSDPQISADPFCAACCFCGEAAAEGSINPRPASAAQQNRSYANYHVIYKDVSKAFLLKPSLKPSAYYGRRPVAKIMKGMTIGVPVVRGFDRQIWKQLHGKKGSHDMVQQPDYIASDAPGTADEDTCAACKAKEEQGQVTDLVLVVHGIGQKFAERVESFHFTHAINAFRREINLELSNPVVSDVLREGQNGIMVLPINWRHALSFEDGGPMTEEDKVTNVPEGFSLKDIEPSSIPAVRSMISDVMFDIPFYMSHHKGKMIKTLVTEANRVYRSWCRNNPGFAENGRVHLIGHSLGSAMAIEILSRQPTWAPRLDLSMKLPLFDCFEFDTTNLFLVGSPAGFFLLLEKGMLLPRRGRMKPGANPADVEASEVTGEVNRFGCIAVDNIYNVLAKEDPIAYLLNGTIDPAYAASLRVAHVPSSANSIFKYVGNAMRSLVSSSAPATGASLSRTASKPPTMRLPSQLELEVHDFTREEIAERKAYLLNDNGQIDYYLRSGGGPLEIQYLNMLSAHTCYWTSQDFIRMLCVEVGRKPGRHNTIPIMRAQKATKRLVAGAISNSPVAI